MGKRNPHVIQPRVFEFTPMSTYIATPTPRMLANPAYVLNVKQAEELPLGVSIVRHTACHWHVKVGDVVCNFWPTTGRSKLVTDSPYPLGDRFRTLKRLVRTLTNLDNVLNSPYRNE